MRRTFGLELTNFINFDPAWKVLKGSRSASRRPRKTVSKSLKDYSGLYCTSSDGFNMPVSETDKHGVSTSGFRFGDKAEHVPIKKRRFLLRSPSPPPVKVSPCTKETADHTRSQDVSDKLLKLPSSTTDINLNQIVDNDNTSIDAKVSDKSNDRFGEDEDFSGISILAAAACSSSLGRDCGYTEDGSGIEESSVLERAHDVSTNTEARSSCKGLLKEDIFNSIELSSGATSSCISTEPIGEFASISTTVNSSQKVATVGKGVKDASLGEDSLTFSEDVSCSKDEEIVRNQRLSSRDERLHWDLNVVMDAWEQPFDDLGVQNNVSHNTSQDAGKVKHNNTMELEDHDLQANHKTVHAAQSCLLRGEPRALTNQISGEIKDNHGIDACLKIEQPLYSVEKSLSSNSDPNLGVMKCSVEDTKYKRHEVTVNPTGGLVVATSDQMNQPSASCTIDEADDASVKSVNMIDKRIGYQPVIQGINSNVGASHDTSGAVSDDTHISLCASSSLETLIKFEQNEAVPEDLETPKIYRCEENAFIEKVDLNPVQPQQHAEYGISDDTRFPHDEAPNFVSKRCERLVALDTKVHDVSNVQDRNINNLSEIYPVTCKEASDSYFDETCKTNLVNCSNNIDNIDHGESLNHSNDVVVKCHPVLVVGTDAAGEPQEDYDSQYEDGELRESSGRAWEEYDAVDKEAENADYMPNYREAYSTNPNDYHVSESGQVEERLGIGASVPAHECNNDNDVYRKAAEAVGNEREEGNHIKSSHVVDKAQLNLGKELLNSPKSFADMSTRNADDYGKKNTMPSHIDGSLDSRGTETRVEPKAFKRGLQSQIEGPVARDDAYREEHKKMENRFDPVSMRSFERVRVPFQNQGRGRHSGGWDGSSDSRRGFRRHYSPIIHGHSKLDNAAAGGRDDPGCVGTQDDVSYSQHLPKGRAGTEGEPCAGFQSRYRADRKFSPDRAGGFGRGRSFRYGPFAESRGGRGRYNGPSPDESFQSSLKYRRPLSRRERSLSPFGGRGQSNIQHSRRKSPSRSRSRSPIIWNSPRRRPGAGSVGNTFLRHRSRSPNFRSEARMQRLRSPQQQPGFGIDHAGGFRPISRNHGSPPRNRWSSARKDEVGQFRELGYKQRTSALNRSPGRIRLRGDRVSAIDSPRNLKPDGYYRISDDAGRAARYEENFEERRKQYNPVRPARRNFDDGMTSRLHQDVNDSFSMGNSFRARDASSFQDRGFRGMDSRIGDGPRRFRGENHSFMYEREGKFNPNTKQFGAEGMDSSHNLKSEEQYRPNFTGRFSDISGANRGCRYENYEDRRKHYSPINTMRRNDSEDTEKRSNYDENIEDAPEFCSRLTRGIDGRIGSLSTRFREDEEPVLCAQEEKLDDNSQSVGVQNSGDNDATNGVVPL